MEKEEKVKVWKWTDDDDVKYGGSNEKSGSRKLISMSISH